MRRFLRSSSVVVSVHLLSVVAVAEQIDTSWVRVKKAVADTMTPEELQAYKERLAENLAYKRPGFWELLGSPETSADICSAATNEISPLPFMSSGTTVGDTDNYDLPPDVNSPTCAASTACIGTGPASSLPRGAIYAGTGTGPDRAYRIRVSAPCMLTISMDPTASEDLALIVYQSVCSSSLADCVCVSDTAFGGGAETVQLGASTGLEYFVVIDGYSTGGVPPGPSGPFDLSISGTGCTLVGTGGTAATCTAAPATTGSLPQGPLAGDTTGQVDDYDLPPDVVAPTGTAPTNCLGAGPPSSLPRGAIYAGTGTGPDSAFRIAVNRNCVLDIGASPTGAWDLALIAYEALCSSSLSNCVCVDDTGIGGIAEAMQLDALAGRTYFVVIDGYSTGGVPPGPSGPFSVSISETSSVGCALVPPCTSNCPIFNDGFEIGSARFWSLRVP